MQETASQPPSTLPKRGASTLRERWAWYLYDFGNSAYAAVVLLAVYSAYFEGQVVADKARGSSLWGIAVGIAMLVVAVISPVLGTMADLSGAKKRFLFVFTAQACLFTALLFFVQRGDVLMGMLFFILAEIGYRSAQVFYNSLLPEIAAPDEIERVSGNGWAVGSVGGIVCLLLVLALITMIEGTLIVRLSLVITALYFALSTIPLFLWLRERAQPQPLPAGETLLSLAFQRLGHTIRAVRSFREFLKFILAFLIYNDGILMILDFGAILGAVLYGLEQQELIIFMILVQLASVAGAYLFGLLANDFGGKRSLIVSLLLTLVPVFWLYFSRSRLEFYFIGALAGFALTGVQSVSRSMVAGFAPPGQSAEFYGFFAVAGRTSSFIGPTIFGLLAAWATSHFMGQGMEEALAKASGHRLALFSIALFLVIGLALLLSVNENRDQSTTLDPQPDLAADSQS
jgi:UMF1 family MFS transporter